MTKKEAIAIIRELNLFSDYEQTIVDIILDVEFESYVRGYDNGYNDARKDYW